MGDRIMRGAQRLPWRSILPRKPPFLPAAVAVRGNSLIRAASTWPPRCSGGDDASSRARSTSLGVAGALSFSVSVAAVVEAKDPPPPELIPEDVVLYQYEACPFCNKVKAFLNYHDIPYKVVEVNPISKKEIKWSDYKKVPIVVLNGEQMNDSSAIIEKLNQKIHSEQSNINDEEAKWCNFSRTERFTVKYAGAAAMYMVSKKLKKKYNITDERAALYDAAKTWTEALNGRDFLGGSKPNLADLAVFGVLRPIRYLRAGKDMVENTKIGDWYQRMEAAVGVFQNQGVKHMISA